MLTLIVGVAASCLAFIAGWILGVRRERANRAEFLFDALERMAREQAVTSHAPISPDEFLKVDLKEDIQHVLDIFDRSKPDPVDPSSK